MIEINVTADQLEPGDVFIGGQLGGWEITSARPYIDGGFTAIDAALLLPTQVLLTRPKISMTVYNHTSYIVNRKKAEPEPDTLECLLDDMRSELAAVSELAVDPDVVARWLLRLAEMVKYLQAEVDALKYHTHSDSGRFGATTPPLGSSDD